MELQDAVDKKGNKVNPDIKGVWFEKEYQRNYPFGSLASSVIGFTSSGNVGTTGLENYYNSTLNGINGREYGYLDSDSDFEKTVIDAQDGDTLVTSIDANIQSIVEEKIKDWNEKYRDNYYKGTGSINTAAIVMNPNNGEILAMADYPNVDLNNPRDLSKWYTKNRSKICPRMKKWMRSMRYGRIFVYPQRMSRDLYRNLLRLRVDSKPEQSKIK